MLLIHETSIASATSIASLLCICGIDAAEGTLDSHPHFFTGNEQREAYTLPCAREVALEFECPFPELRVQLQDPFVGFPRNVVITMQGLHDRFWQAIVAPGSDPLILVGYRLFHGAQINIREKRLLDAACESHIRVDACYYRMRAERERRFNSWGARLERLLAKGSTRR